MSVIGSNILAGASGQGGDYTIARSLRFRSSASAYLNRTFGSGGNLKTWTLSAWVKRGSLGSDQQLFGWWEFGGALNNQHWIGFTSNNDIEYKLYDGQANIHIGRKVTTQVFRDPSAWYHFVFVWDTTNATASSRMRIYVNGNEITSYSISTNPSQNTDGYVNLTSPNALHTLGAVFDSSYSASPLNVFDGYMTEVQFIDGQALTPSSFGATNASTGVWQPKKYSGTYGTNGFYLPFTDNSGATSTTIGKDFSGNSNNWTPNNISVTAGATYDSMTDVPTLTSATAANYCVLNPLSVRNTVLSNANLTSSMTGAAGGALVSGTMALPSSSKIYCEATITSTGDETVLGVTSAVDTTVNAYNAVIGYRYSGSKVVTGSVTSYGASYTTGDVIGMAVDTSAGTIEFFKNNTSQGVITNSNISSLTMFFACVYYSSTSSAGQNWNFGQRPFAYTPPTGFVALNTFNLPTPTIGATASTQAVKYMDATIWSGDNTTPRSISNSGSFQPDFVWIKSRSNAYQHNLYDAVRGAGSAYALSSDSTGAEGGNSSTYGYLSAFNSTGFQVTQGTAGSGAAPNGNAYTNQSGSTYVAWQWKANGSGSSNTAGSITSTVSANTSAGFSVVTYTGNNTSGATVGHGLGVTPAFVIVKKRSGATNWRVGTSANASAALPIDGYLNLTLGLTRDTSTFQSFSSTTITLGNSDDVNGGSGGTYVAYCFAEVAGYSKFGSYTGNGSTDGTFVYTGFRPKYVMVKRTDSTGNWAMLDTARSPINQVGEYLLANASDAEVGGSVLAIDALSNGFKLRVTQANINASGGTYIYMAFAENPFKYSLAR